MDVREVFTIDGRRFSPAWPVFMTRWSGSDQTKKEALRWDLIFTLGR